MIVIGVDVHKQSLTAVAVDEVGRALCELTIGSPAELVGWSSSLDPNRLWAVEDCRQLTGPLERRLLAAGDVVDVTGLFAAVGISHSEVANDTLAIHTLGGDDNVVIGGGVAALIQTLVDLGADE